METLSLETLLPIMYTHMKANRGPQGSYDYTMLVCKSWYVIAHYFDNSYPKLHRMYGFYACYINKCSLPNRGPYVPPSIEC